MDHSRSLQSLTEENLYSFLSPFSLDILQIPDFSPLNTGFFIIFQSRALKIQEILSELGGVDPLPSSARGASKSHLQTAPDFSPFRPDDSPFRPDFFPLMLCG
jgi:hypothetical protein